MNENGLIWNRPWILQRADPYVYRHTDGSCRLAAYCAGVSPALSMAWRLYSLAFSVKRADPYVYRHTDGSYYFTASVPAYDRIVLRRAPSPGGPAHSST